MGYGQLLVLPSQAQVHPRAVTQQQCQSQGNDDGYDGHAAVARQALLHFHLIDAEQRVQLINLRACVLLVDRVCQLVDALVHVGCLLILAQSFHDLGALQVNQHLRRLIVVLTALLQPLRVIVERLLVVPALQPQLGTVVGDAHGYELALVPVALLGLVDGFLGFVKVSQSQIHLGAGQVVVGVPHTAVQLLAFFLALALNQLVDGLLPFLGDDAHLLIPLLLLQHVAVVREDVVHDSRLQVSLLDECQALVVAADGFVKLPHVVVGIAHGVVGQCQTVWVVALSGVLVHQLHLLQPRVHLPHEDIRVHQQRPRLVVVLPAVLLLMELHVPGSLVNQ